MSDETDDETKFGEELREALDATRETQRAELQRLAAGLQKTDEDNRKDDER